MTHPNEPSDTPKPIDHELAEGFAQLHPPEDLLSVLIRAAQDRPIQTPVARPSRWLLNAVLGLAVAAVAAVVLQRGLDTPREEATTTSPGSSQSAPLDVPAGQRAASFHVERGREAVQPGDIIDVLRRPRAHTTPTRPTDTGSTEVLVASVRVLAAQGRVTVACSPEQALQLAEAQHEHLEVALHVGTERAVPVQVGISMDEVLREGDRVDVIRTSGGSAAVIVADAVVHRRLGMDKVMVRAAASDAPRLFDPQDTFTLTIR